MILSINLRTHHGHPGWLPLEPPSRLLTFTTKANENVEAYLGAKGLANNLPKGFSVNIRALQKEPWVFSKTLYLAASGLLLKPKDEKDGGEYHHTIELNQTLVCRALPSEGQWYAYIVVEPSKNPRYQYFPFLVDHENI